jgi:hypothetical protein
MCIIIIVRYLPPQEDEEFIQNKKLLVKRHRRTIELVLNKIIKIKKKFLLNEMSRKTRAL